jgi:hypothetical protein
MKVIPQDLIDQLGHRDFFGLGQPVQYRDQIFPDPWAVAASGRHGSPPFKIKLMTFSVSAMTLMQAVRGLTPALAA